MPIKEDTDRQRAIKLEHLSPSWVEALDKLVGESGMFCDVAAIFRGMARPITKLTTELRLNRRTND